MVAVAAFVAPVGVDMVALIATAVGSTLRAARYCRGADGISNDGNWQTSAPFLISIARRTTLNIARRAGKFEGKPVTQPRWVPCNVAESVAFDALEAWANWSGNDGWVGVSLAVATGKPYLGRFYCTGESTASGGAIETCTHRANTHAGRITVRFTIERRSSASGERLSLARRDKRSNVQG